MSTEIENDYRSLFVKDMNTYMTKGCWHLHLTERRGYLYEKVWKSCC